MGMAEGNSQIGKSFGIAAADADARKCAEKNFHSLSLKDSAGLFSCL